ncbi:hypothetical protein ACFVZW_25195 [Streptomyces sp. NPDC059567]|uniref:hypothetical protein n=1 Tax=Streptomyces sp. NPDC059567 TaxID=3346867 RepID=UPI0036AC8F73
MRPPSHTAARSSLLVPDAPAPDRARLVERVHAVVADARTLGLTDDELLSLVRTSLAGP